MNLLYLGPRAMEKNETFVDGTDKDYSAQNVQSDLEPLPPVCLAKSLK